MKFPPLLSQLRRAVLPVSVRTSHSSGASSEKNAQVQVTFSYSGQEHNTVKVRQRLVSEHHLILGRSERYVDARLVVLQRLDGGWNRVMLKQLSTLITDRNPQRTL
jgi:ABC-type sulfate transport system substrate-binding protein